MSNPATGSSSIGVETSCALLDWAMDRPGSETRASITIALIYLVLGVVWTVLTSRWLSDVSFSSAQELGRMFTLKNLIFIILSTFALFFVVRIHIGAVSRSESKLNSLIRNSPYGIFTTAANDDSFQLANPALIKMLGCATEEDMLKLSLLRDISVDPEQWSRFLDEIRRTGHHGQELSWKRTDGKALKVYATGQTFTDNAESTYLQFIVEDITERRKLEDELRQVQKLETIGSLASGVAHDFNNILMAIGGYAELLGFQIPEGDPKWRYVDQISKAVGRGTGLSQQLLAFSRKQDLRPIILSANDALSEAISMLRPILGSHIRIKIAPSTNRLLFKADKVQTEQVLLNLMVNARDAMPQGGMLTLGTTQVEFETEKQFPQFTVKPGRYVVITVGDTGMGMSPETQARIFEPFFTTKASKGTGLGLTTVFGIMKQSGGAVRLHSEVGKGTVFQLYFPAAKQGELPEMQAGKRSLGSYGTILLVDDEDVIREGLKQFLEMRGYSVLQANDAPSAIGIIKEKNCSVQLMLSDVQLPGSSGQDLSKQVKTLCPSVKVLLMSGLSLQKLENHNDIHFIQKPFKLEALAGKLQEMLGEK